MTREATIAEAIKLTRRLGVKRKAKALMDNGWKFLGTGTYKSAFRKGDVVVKIFGVGATDMDGEWASEHHRGRTTGFHRMREFDPRAGEKPMEWVRLYQRLNKEARAHVAEPLFADEHVLIQPAIPYASCDAVNNCDNFTEALETIRSCGKVRFEAFSDGDHNHGHVGDKVVFYDGY